MTGDAHRGDKGHLKRDSVPVRMMEKLIEFAGGFAGESGGGSHNKERAGGDKKRGKIPLRDDARDGVRNGD